MAKDAIDEALEKFHRDFGQTGSNFLAVTFRSLVPIVAAAARSLETIAIALNGINDELRSRGT